MASLKVTLGQVNVTNHLKFVMREVSSPLAVVYSQLFAPPHNTVRIFTAQPLNPVNHYVDWYEADSLGNEIELIHTTEVDLSIIEDVAWEILEFVVDRGNTDASPYDPDSGQNEYRNPDLAGAEYNVFRPGYGIMSWESDLEKVDEGGFDLLNDLVFFAQERWTLMISKKSTFNIGSNASGFFPVDFVDVESDRDIDTSDFGKMLEGKGSSDILTLSIPDLDAIPEKTQIGVSNTAGNHRYINLSLPSGKYCRINGVNRQNIYIGKGERATFFKKGSELKVVEPASGWQTVGNRVTTDGTPPPNGIAELGGWHLKTDYPRLFEWFVSSLPGVEIIAGTDDVTPNAATRTKWVVGTNKFWVPDSGGYFDRHIDPNTDVDTEGGARVSGQTQDDENKEHNHTPGNDANGTNYGLIPTAISGSKTPNGHDSTGNGSEPNVRDSPKLMLNSGGVEARPKNRATNVYRLI